MKKRFLIVAHYSRFLVQFEMNDVKLLQELGYEVHYATNYEKEDMYADAPEKIKDAGVILHQIDFVRSPYKLKENVCAYRQLKNLMKRIKFDGVHCHTPMGGMLARLAAKATKTGPVLYTAHGFHFYKGAPMRNWLLYYPIEKMCSYVTDVLITINQEDFSLAKKKMKAKKIVHIPGVGIDLNVFFKGNIDKECKCKELGISPHSRILLSVGELNKNKNQEVIINAIAKLKDYDIVYLVVGQGEKKESLQKLACNLGIGEKVVFLGFRTDIRELCNIADIFCFPSFREGLGLAALEAMACGLPLVTSNVHGINDYSENGVTGYKVAPTDIQGFASSIEKIIKSEQLREQFGQNSCSRSREFDIRKVNKEMEKIYREMK